MLEFSNSLKTTIISRKNDTIKKVAKDDQNIESYERNRQSILIYGMLSQILSLFFLLLLLHFPQKPSILGTPTELPHPKIINFDLILIYVKKFFKIISSIENNFFS